MVKFDLTRMLYIVTPTLADIPFAVLTLVTYYFGNMQAPGTFAFEALSTAFGLFLVAWIVFKVTKAHILPKGAI